MLGLSRREDSYAPRMYCLQKPSRVVLPLLSSSHLKGLRASRVRVGEQGQDFSVQGLALTSLRLRAIVIYPVTSTPAWPCRLKLSPSSPNRAGDRPHPLIFPVPASPALSSPAPQGSHYPSPCAPGGMPSPSPCSTGPTQPGGQRAGRSSPTSSRIWS